MGREDLEVEVTAKQLIKKLEAIVKKHGNIRVCAEWQALKDESNGVYEIANVSEVKFEFVHQVDGDGFGIENKDGTERFSRCAVIR